MERCEKIKIRPPARQHARPMVPAATLENRRYLVKKTLAAFELSTATGFRGAGACRCRYHRTRVLPGRRMDFNLKEPAVKSFCFYFGENVLYFSSGTFS